MNKKMVWFFIGVCLATAAPAMAKTVVDYARNAGKVDGLSAVRAGTSPGRRAGKIVATDGSGRLPNGIIAKAPDTRRFDNLSVEDFVLKCDSGPASFGWAQVRADVPSEWTEVTGAGISMGGYLHEHGIPDPCGEHRVVARRVTTGVYRVQVTQVGKLLFCDGPSEGPAGLSAQVTVVDDQPTVATYQNVCDEELGSVQEVHLYDLDGRPIDGTFVIELLSAVLNV